MQLDMEVLPFSKGQELCIGGTYELASQVASPCHAPDKWAHVTLLPTVSWVFRMHPCSYLPPLCAAHEALYGSRTSAPWQVRRGGGRP